MHTLTEWKADNCRMLSPDMIRIVFENVKKDDTMVPQCNASNIRGYSFDNAVLNVIHWYVYVIITDQIGVLLS